MSLAALIADMVRAGVDPDLIGRTAELVAHASPSHELVAHASPSHELQSDKQRTTNADRQARYRERKRNETVTRNVTSVTVTPPPSLDKKDTPKPLEKINPTPGCAAGAPAYVHMREASPSRQADDQLETELREAAGLQGDPSPSLMVIGPIKTLMAGGIPKALILQTITDKTRQRAAKGQGPPRSWDYFTEPIKQAHANAINAANLPPPESSHVKQSAKQSDSISAAVDRLRSRLEGGSGNDHGGHRTAFGDGPQAASPDIAGINPDSFASSGPIIDGSCVAVGENADGPIPQRAVSGC